MCRYIPVGIIPVLSLYCLIVVGRFEVSVVVGGRAGSCER